MNVDIPSSVRDTIKTTHSSPESSRCAPWLAARLAISGDMARVIRSHREGDMRQRVHRNRDPLLIETEVANSFSRTYGERGA